MNNITCSIIIVTYNSIEFIQKCISSIYEYVEDLNYEIIIADNNSQDGTQEYVKNKFSDITVLASSKNEGYSRAINRGVEHSKGEYCLILNPDIEFTTDSISQLISFYKERPDTGVLGCSLLFPDGRSQRSYFRYPSLTGRLAYYMGITRRINIETIKKVQKGSIVTVDVVCGALMLIQRDKIIEIGGFDGNYFLYQEEADFCYRLQQKGNVNRIIEEVSVIHHGDHGETPDNETVFFHRNRSLLIYFYKHKSIIALWSLLKFNIVLFNIFYYFTFLNIPPKKNSKKRREIYKKTLDYHWKFIRYLVGNKKDTIPE